jgi:hypothetical protein
MRPVSVLFLAGVMAIAACDKGGGAKGSGDMSSSELSLFKQLPGNNVALFGGNYMKMQHFMSSTMGKAIAANLKDEKAEKWMDCFTKAKDMHVAGGVALEGSKLTMRVAFTGLKIADIADCAKKAEFNTVVDPDGKFVSIDITTAGMTVNQGYLAMPSDALYSRTTIAFGMPPSFGSGTRPELESDLAAAAKSNAGGDDKLLKLLAKVDRNQTFWFAGTADGTPAASKLGELYGSIDLDSGLGADVTAQLKDSDMAEKISDGLKEAKKHADELPGELKGAIQGIDVSRDGDHLRFKMKLSESQLSSLMSMSGMGGMGRRH